MMAQYREYLRWCVEQGIESQSSTVLSLEDYSARIIQSWWRRLAGLVQVSSIQHSLYPRLLLLQLVIRAGSGKWSLTLSMQKGVRLKPRVLDEQTAAAIIQRMWRSFSVNVQDIF